jgi:hypothetical protein
MQNNIFYASAGGSLRLHAHPSDHQPMRECQHVNPAADPLGQRSVASPSQTAGMVRFNDRPIAERLGIIIAAVCLMNAILIAIPGYFSFDELVWQRFIASGHGGWSFFLADLGQSPFYRPLGSLFISLALRLPLQPFASHAALVFLQSLNCGLLYWLVRDWHPQRALAAALLFAVMPGTAFAAGWIAAFFDLEFTFFALCSLGAALRFWRRGHWIWGAWSVGAFVAGLLCKETALTIPVAAAALAVCDHARVELRRLSVLCAAAAGVISVYAVLRMPVLMHMGTGTGSYAFGRLADMGRNALAYFCFPFVFTMPDIDDLMARSLTLILPAVGLHVLLIAALWLRYGRSAPLLYLVAYFIPLLPVVILSKYETQYVYASSIAVSVALALLWRPRPSYAIPTIALTAVLLLHALRIQQTMYTMGACQTRALQSVAGILPFVASSSTPSIYTPDDVRWWVLARALYQHPFQVGGRTIDVTYSHRAAGTSMTFLSDCSVTLNSGS